MALTLSAAHIGVSILTTIAVGISAAAFFRPPEAILESMAEIAVLSAAPRAESFHSVTA